MWPNSFVQVVLSMRKVGPPNVVIGWELILVDEAEALSPGEKMNNC